MRNEKEKQHDALNNEGHEGYNPHRDNDLPAPVAEEDRDRESLIREKVNLGCHTSPTYNHQRADELDARIAALDAATEQSFWAEWTREITASRRAAWNTFAAGLKSVTHPLVRVAAQEREQGWTMANLKRAITHYGL